MMYGILDGWTPEQKVALIACGMAIIAPTWGTWWNARVAKKNVTPNGGKSLADKATRIETHTERMAAQLDLQDVILEQHTAEIHGVKGELRTFKHTLTQVQHDVAELQKAQAQRREIIEQEQENTGETDG